jgi:hypothetical protein
MSDGWDAFVASLDPVKLERERMRAPGRGERPGSVSDRRMREMHRVRVERVRRGRLPSITGEGFVALLRESEEFDSGSNLVMPVLARLRREKAAAERGAA